MALLTLDLINDIIAVAEKYAAAEESRLKKLFGSASGANISDKPAHKESAPTEAEALVRNP